MNPPVPYFRRDGDTTTVAITDAVMRSLIRELYPIILAISLSALMDKINSCVWSLETMIASWMRRLITETCADIK